MRNLEVLEYLTLNPKRLYVLKLECERLLEIILCYKGFKSLYLKTKPGSF